MLFRAENTMSQTIRIDSRPACAQCKLEWKHVATLDGNSVSGWPAWVSRGLDGRIYVIDQVERLPFVFSQTGRFERKLGRQGAGPGEYRSARAVLVGTNGRIHILDPSLGRHTVLSKDGDMAATKPLPGGTPSLASAAVLADDRIVTNQLFRDPASAGFLLQEVDPSGKRLRLFEEVERYDMGETWPYQRLLFARQNGEIWSAHPYNYVIDLYSRDRKKIMAITRIADWVGTPDRMSGPSAGDALEPPWMEMRALWDDRDGLLWTGTLVPSRSWQPTKDSNRALPINERYETVIEVLDPKAGALVTSLRVRQMVVYGLGNGYVATYLEGADGTPSIEVWMVQLGPPR
jgi:hypothetical protein